MKTYEAKAQFEVSFSANGSYFLVIYGKHENGGFCCIPNRNLGCEMAEPQDTFYNYEKLRGAGLSEENAKAVAQMIKKAAEEIPSNLRNYGQIKFEKDLPEYITIDEGSTADGHIYELATVEPGNGEPCNEPIVIFKNRAYILRWEDIVALAEKAELFDDAGGVIKALTQKGVLL